MQLLSYILILISVSVNLAEINPKWRDPSAFERHRSKAHFNEGSGDACPQVQQYCEAPSDPYADTAAAMFYKKFVRFIFNRKRLLKDGLSNTYLRDIQFQITEEELVKLESTSDIREIDGIISDIVAKSKDSSLHNMVMTEVSYHLSNIVQLLTTKNGMFVMGGLCFIILIWVISRHSKKGIFASALIAMIAVSYVITYMQCNDKKATDKLIKLMQHDQKYCAVSDKPDAGILNSLRSFFAASPDSQCISKMREAYSSELEICSPAEVFVVMVAQLNMKYFEEFGHQLIKTYRSLTESHSWFEKIFIFALMIIFVAMLIHIFVKFTLKYGFQYMWHSNNSGSHTTNAATVEASRSHQKLTETLEQLNSTCDGLAGLAKKIKRQRSSNKPKIIIVDSASRVQEIKAAPKESIDNGASGDNKELDELNESDTSVDSDLSDVEVAIDFLKASDGRPAKDECKPSSKNKPGHL